MRDCGISIVVQTNGGCIDQGRQGRAGQRQIDRYRWEKKSAHRRSRGETWEKRRQRWEYSQPCGSDHGRWLVLSLWTRCAHPKHCRVSGKHLAGTALLLRRARPVPVPLRDVCCHERHHANVAGAVRLVLSYRTCCAVAFEFHSS